MLSVFKRGFVLLDTLRCEAHTTIFIKFCFKVGSFNYDNSKMVFVDEFIADHTQIRSVLDYSIEIR